MANTCLSPAQVSQLWTSNGGPASALGDVIPIVWAESGGCTDPAGGGGAFGLTQIQGDPAAAGDPNYAIRKMIQMSNGGTNWSPWCSAWADPNGNCGKGTLAHVQGGSAAAKFLHLGPGAQDTAPGATLSANPFAVLDSFNKFFGALTSATTWRNLGEILAGAVFVLVGALITRDALRGGASTKDIGSLVQQGKGKASDLALDAAVAA